MESKTTQNLISKFQKTIFFILVALSLTTIPTASSACMMPHERVFPTCEVSAPTMDERTTVIYANSGAGLSSLAVGNELSITEVVDVEIDASSKPHYIALSSGKPLIWRFSGEVETISRIVVFGSQYRGPEFAGIVGVPEEKIHWSQIDFEALKSVGPHSCPSVYRACELSAYFQIPEADRMMLVGARPADRFQVDQFVERLRGHTIRIPQDGWSEAKERGRWVETGGVAKMTGPASGRYEAFGGTGYNQDEAHERGIIEIPEKDLISPSPAQRYDVFPGEIGLNQLVIEGVLVAKGEPEFEVVYEKWDDEISAPFRSQFDPDFSFAYKIDYLVKAPTRLPTGLTGKSFLVAAGVEQPSLGANRQFNACLFFADLRDLPIDTIRIKDPRCDRAMVTRAIPDKQSAFNQSKDWLKELEDTSWKAPDVCQLEELGDDVSLVAVVLSEGDRKRHLTDGSRRNIDLKIERAGKVAIYLDMNGGRIDWHVNSADATEIVGVFTRRDISQMQHKITGLNESVQVKSLGGVWRKNKGCRGYSPTYHAHLGGPAILQLNESMKALLGKPLDRVIRETDDGTWPRHLNDPEAERTTFVID